jgi:hypothetical protein
MVLDINYHRNYGVSINVPWFYYILPWYKEYYGKNVINSWYTMVLNISYHRNYGMSNNYHGFITFYHGIKSTMVKM